MGNNAALEVDVSGIPKVGSSQVITEGSTNSTSVTPIISRTGSGYVQMFMVGTSGQERKFQFNIDGSNYMTGGKLNTEIEGAFCLGMFRYESSYSLSAAVAASGTAYAYVIDWRD